MRWLLPLTAKLNMDAVHKAHQLGELMTDEQIREAGQLSGHPTEAETAVVTLQKCRSVHSADRPRRRSSPPTRVRTASFAPTAASAAQPGLAATDDR